MRTKPASEYLLEKWKLHRSVSTLQKFRCRGPDDPRDRGPDFTRDPVTEYCDYQPIDLDRYAANLLAARGFRAPAVQPERLRIGRKRTAPRRRRASDRSASAD
jgi:hypothetical protein